jgi:predicted regulator of Ras-like GTPase activity (Roadblock/LC7/MglB family)
MPNALDLMLETPALGAEVPALVLEADALRAGGALEAAREVAERAVQADPLLPPGHVVLARIYLALGEPGRAHAAWETALRLDPHNPAALRGMVYLACQRRDRASALRFAQAVTDGGPAETERLDVVAAVSDHFAADDDQDNRADVRTAPRGVPTIDSTPTTTSSANGATPLTVLMVDEAGLTIRALASSRDAGSTETTGAILSELACQGSLIAKDLGLGPCRELMVEAEEGSVAMAPVPDGLWVIVVGGRDAPLGSVRFGLTRARVRAAGSEEAL